MVITKASSPGRDVRMDPRRSTSSVEHRPAKRDFTVYVVEDDVEARQAMIDVVGTMNLRAVGLDSAESFLHEYNGKPSILVCDIRMPGMSGLELQKYLVEHDMFVPAVIVTGFPRVRHVVEAIQNGAVTVLEKPFTSDDLWLSLREAIKAYEGGFTHHETRLDARDRYATLTPQEQVVLRLILDSQTNKKIANQLDVSVRTVEARRRKILDKMNVESIVELVRLVDLVKQ